MRAPFRRWNGVAIGMDKAVIDTAEPRNRPFERAVAALLFDFSGKNLIGNKRASFNIGGEIVFKAGWETENGLRRNIRAFNKRWCAGPADFDTATQLGF